MLQVFAGIIFFLQDFADFMQISFKFNFDFIKNVAPRELY